MNIEFILNDALNKALCQKGRIQNPNSNTIAEFVTKYLQTEKINYTRCCTELCECEKPSLYNNEEWVERCGICGDKTK